MSNLNLDSILKELSNMKFEENSSNSSNNSRPPRKSSIEHSKKQSRLTTNFNNLLDELEETKEYLEKDNSINREPPIDRIGRRKYSASSNNSRHDYNRSRSRSRSEVDRWRENSPNSRPHSPVEKKKFPSRISSMNPSNKMKLNTSQYRSRENSKSSSRVQSVNIPEKPSPVNQNFEFDDDNMGSLPSSYRDDYEHMMNNYSKNTSPNIKTRKDESISPPLRTQRISSKPSSKYNSPKASPDPYSKSYNSNNDVSPYYEKKSISKKKSYKNRSSDDESEEEDEINDYRNTHKSRKSKYNDNDNDDDDDIFLYENDADNRHSRKTSPVHAHSNRAYSEDDFDEDESDITLSESTDSFMSSEEESSYEERNSESEIDDDDVPLQSAKIKSTGIRGRNRHYKKFNTVETSSNKEEKSPKRNSKSLKSTSSIKKEKKKRAPSNSSRNTPIAPLSSNSLRSPKENYYEETARENFLARSKKDFTTDYAEASLKKITTRIYIGDASVYESVMLTSAMPASEVIKDLIRRRNIPDTPDWTLFELCNDFGVGKYIIAVGRFPSIRGKIYMETKPGKYNKKQFELRPNGLYYYKKKSSPETLLVNLNSYDVYTLLVQMPNAPTEFAFAIKSTDPIHFFEDKKKYIYYLYTTDINSLFDWVMSIRQGKTEKYVLEQHEKESNSPNVVTRSPTGLIQKQQTYRTQPTLLEEKQRIKSAEIQKIKKHAKEGNGPLVQIDQLKTKSSSRNKSIRKSTGGLPSASRSRKDKGGPLINLDGAQTSSSIRKGSQSAVQTPLSSSSRRGPKPLVDISDAKNCHYCGCSENKYDPWKQNVCANCHHDHRAYQ
ncbi:hypothetical protein LY90DRAFT_699162 [Neocallimastix californiae]|uniref:PH domain-containing protein n=1 Tax=Neocallimastix californiae TaxID=1754190 RepID=A0A1Y2EVU3_9FUNG|nr:hypothetical protein LY90DRAFT_699162 [Neocallimastix californiae]|eukprot:ORY74945.1 hypothetical protein LY90DRAFT_699162 [Neocallimastix californiae]